jgi:hypothetical protein
MFRHVACAAMLCAVGCLPASAPPPAPVKLPAGSTFEIYDVAPMQGPNTKPAVDPLSGRPVQLRLPPIIETADVATVARAVEEGRTTTGAVSPRLALEVNPTSAGAAKLYNATATPAGQTLAVVINGRLVAVPRVHAPITSSFQVSGNGPSFTAAVDALVKP